MATPRIESTDRQARALELRVQGLEYQEIAQHLGYADKASAYNACKAVIARREYEAVDEMRAIEGARLDKITDVLWPLVKSGDLAAIDRLLKVMQRRANLFGLDLAGRLDTMAAAEVDLDGAVARIIAIARGNTPTPDPEGDEADGL